MKWEETYNFKSVLNSKASLSATLSLGVYTTLSLLYVLSYALEQPNLRLYLKPLLIPILCFFYGCRVTAISPKIIGAMLFSFLGDVFLMGTGVFFFLAGLSSFLVAHLFYLSALWPKWKPIQVSKKIIPLLCYMVYLVVFMYLLWPTLNELKIPVLFYAMVLSLHGIISLSLAINRHVFAWPLALGVFLFIISDSMIALNSFYFDTDYFGEWVMLTYLTAQALIILYFTKTNKT